MKVYHITEAGRTEPPLGGLGDRTTNRGPSVSSPATASGPLKGQSIKLNGVSYQFKGNAWVVTDTSEFKGRNPPKKGQLADRNAKELLNQKSAKLNGGGGASKADAPKVDPKVDPKADAPKADAPKAKPGLIKRGAGMLGRGFLKGALGPLITATTVSGYCEVYYKRIAQLVEEGVEVKKSDAQLSEIRIKMVEGIVGDFAAMAIIIAGGARAGMAILRAFSSAALLAPGAGWVAAAISGAVYLGTGVLISVATKFLTSRQFAVPLIDWFIDNWLTNKLLHELALDYAKISGKPYAYAVESISLEEDAAASNLRAASKQLVSGDKEIQAALKKAKEKGITSTSAAKAVIQQKLT